VSESSGQDDPLPPASAVHQALEDPEVRQALAAALFEALESRRPPNRYHARQVVQRYVELGRDFTREERYALAEEAFAKALELSENQGLDIEEEHLEARVEQVNADPETGKANPKGLKECGFVYRLHLQHGRGSAKQRNTLGSYRIFLVSDHPPSEAEDVLRESVRLDTTNAAAFVHLGNVISDRGRGVEAEAVYRRAIALDSTSAPAHFDLGVLLDQGGREPEAESAYRKAVSLEPSDRDAPRVLVDLLERTGHRPEAQALRARMRLLPARRSPVQRSGVSVPEGGSGEESKPDGPDPPP